MWWQPYQQYRLAQEKVLLRQNLPDFEFSNPLENTFIGGWWNSNSNRNYYIRVELAPGYPEEQPATYIASPSPLMGYYAAIESYGASHAMHTYRTNRPGWVQICIFHPDDWSSEYTLVKILHKAMLWLTAYEGHLVDGRNIEHFLIHA